VLARGSDQSWRLETTLSPSKMKLEPGDALIYRAVAADRRPGDAGVASSDTYFVEIAGPGDVALAGVEMPPDKERYALSEAMIVLKIERLMAREKGMARPALEEAAGNIGAEQRAVRANFIFLLGGEIEDEDVEAETSSEIAEGRFANKARQEIVAATVLMGRVERALTAVSTREALGFARDAVRALQRAFGHSRYLLRALPARARLDPARRLSGDLASAADWNRALAPPASDPQTDAARSALMAWRQFDLGWVEVFPRQAPVAAGSVVAVLIRHLGFWSLNGARVVYEVGSRIEGHRFGFAYGTLTNHAEAGEELFEVFIDPPTGDVVYRLRAASRPRAALARLGKPIVRALQARFRRDSLASMTRGTALAGR